ncbi:hypothetical protein OG422_00090 [Streptomyces sp. NBC_01525]|uniref:Uncharacterized protein n=1 Tax=Streptomyces benahoarensis TaxID=2595054 RepID=A0A553YW17_9ACTN|nr:hypothetical protein [Streptomyces benahoarensis]TSB17725.1 hypothetical protein FNJ62_26680 [Streptomyces benahoarensis]TSB33418.1 hypothetical protein FNZ23_23665 [Streptomyces benahoarensis]
MRNRITAALVATIALAGTVVLGTTQASAAPAQAPQQATPANVADAPPGWVLRDKYWTHGGCVEAGQDGVQRHHWDEFQCANGNLQWVLWTNR